MAGKSLLVTGALGGVGSAVVDLAVREGAKAVVLADLDAERVAASSESLSTAAVPVYGLVLDVASEQSWIAAVRTVRDEFSGFDVLVNNAGITDRRGVLDTELADWNRVLGVNLTGVFLGMRHGGRAMSEAGGGAIVNVASFASYTGYRAASYTAAKWGVRGLTQAAADELGPLGVRVNSVSPGFLPTPLTENAPNLVRSFSAATPLGRTCTPADIAAAVLYLACDDSAYVCGQDLVVDGGFLANSTRGLHA